jgi:hypothetical protein
VDFQNTVGVIAAAAAVVVMAVVVVVVRIISTGCHGQLPQVQISRRMKLAICI